MWLYLQARLAAGLVDAVRRATLENIAMFWRYSIGLGLLALALEHMAPYLLRG
jgi:hypothetical protein